MLTQPLDIDPNVTKLWAKFPPGVLFTRSSVEITLGIGATRARRFIGELKTALTFQPEGIQLISRRGAPANGGGLRFVIS